MSFRAKTSVGPSKPAEEFVYSLRCLRPPDARQMYIYICTIIYIQVRVTGDVSKDCDKEGDCNYTEGPPSDGTEGWDSQEDFSSDDEEGEECTALVKNMNVQARARVCHP